MSNDSCFDEDPREALTLGHVDASLDSLLANMHRCALEMEALQKFLKSTRDEVQQLAECVGQAASTAVELVDELERAKRRG
jgi:uncharacterized protein Yka (UPF0111/DUF47 family)